MSEIEIGNILKKYGVYFLIIKIYMCFKVDNKCVYKAVYIKECLYIFIK